MWVSTHCGFHLRPKTPSLQWDLTLFLSYFGTQTHLFCRAHGSQSFTREGEEKGKKKKRGVGAKSFLDSLQIIKVSCFSLKHSLLPSNWDAAFTCNSYSGNPSRCKQTACVCECVCMLVCMRGNVVRNNKTGWLSFRPHNHYKQGECNWVIAVGPRGLSVVS